MGTVMTRDEATQRHRAAVAGHLRRLLAAPEVHVPSLAWAVEGLPDLARDVLAGCQRDEPGPPGEGVPQAAERLGRERFRSLVAEAIERLLPDPGSPEAAAWISAYDFLHPARVNKDQLRTLESLHDNFARLLASSLSGIMRAVVDVDTAFVDQTTYGEFIHSLAKPSCSYQFTLGPTGGQAIVDVAPPLAFALIDRVFGGTGSAEGQPTRPLTPVEMAQVNLMAKRLFEDLETAWKPILQVEVSDIELETDPEFMQLTAATEIVVLLAFEVNAPCASGLVSLCYPFFTLESILPRLGQRGSWRAADCHHEERLLINRLRLGAMPLEATVELGRTCLTLGEIHHLEVGDVVRLPVRVDEPVTICFGGKPKLLAHPFATADGRLGAKVVGTR
jgi:flagellar motor switch protein FliM